MKNTCEAQLKILCSNVKAIRTSAKIGVEEMAQKLGITVSELESIECGLMPKSVTVEILFRIQTHFGIHPKDMFDHIIL